MRSYLNPLDDLWADGVGPYSRNEPNDVDAPIELRSISQASNSQSSSIAPPEYSLSNPELVQPARAHLPPNTHPNDPLIRNPEPVLPAQNTGNAISVRRPWYRWCGKCKSTARQINVLLVAALIITVILLIFALIRNKSPALSYDQKQHCKQIWIDGGWSRIEELEDASCVKIDWFFQK